MKPQATLAGSSDRMQTKVVRIGEQKPRVSRFAAQQQARESGIERFELDLDNDEEVTRRARSSGKSIIGGIVEREASAPVEPFAATSAGFPVAPVRSQAQRPTSRARRSSISFESDAKLAGMSPQEIEEGQQEIAQMLSPRALDFLRRRHAQQATEVVRSKPVPGLPRSAADGKVSRDAHVGSSHVHDGHWHAANAHSISELLQLCRSSVTAQRSAGLIMLSRMLINANQGLLSASDGDALRAARGDIYASAIFGLSRAERSMSVVSASLSVLEVLQEQETPIEVIRTLLDALAQQLELSILPRDRLSALLRLLSFQAASYSNEMLSTPRLLETVVRRFVRVPWPSADPDDDLPSPLAIEILIDIVSSHRDNARALMARAGELVDPLLRYLACPLSALSQAQQPLGVSMLIGLLKLWTALGRYGLAAQMRSAPGMDELLVRLDRLETSKLRHLKLAWIDLKTAWMNCATVPHSTEPPHSILWSQVETWGVAACEEVGSLNTLFDSDDEMAIRTLVLVGRWLRGVPSEAHIELRNSILVTDRDIPRRLYQLLGEALEFGDYRKAENVSTRIQVFMIITRVRQMQFAELIAPVLSALLSVDRAAHKQLRQTLFIATELIGNLQNHSLDQVLKMMHLLSRNGVSAGPQYAARAIDLASQLHPALVDQRAIIKPLVARALKGRPTFERLAPVVPDDHLAEITTLRASQADFAPLFPPLWVLSSVLDVLSSGNDELTFEISEDAEVNTSPAGIISSAIKFQLVLASNQLTGQEMMPTLLKYAGGIRASHSAIIFELCRLYLIIGEDASSEPIRSSVAQFCTLLHPTPAISSNLEEVAPQSRVFLPIYQDLLALHDQTLLATHDDIFAALLLAPLASHYPVDYRRSFWHGRAQSLHGIDVAFRNLFQETESGLALFKEPPEVDETVLGGMAVALAIGRLSRGSALREIAIHHLKAAWRDDRALTLRALLEKTSDASVQADL